MDTRDVARIVAYELRQIRAHYKGGKEPGDNEIAAGAELAYEAISDKLVAAGLEPFPALRPLDSLS